jgi:hypothetical protein
VKSLNGGRDTLRMHALLHVCKNMLAYEAATRWGDPVNSLHGGRAKHARLSTRKHVCVPECVCVCFCIHIHAYLHTYLHTHR